MDERWFRGGMSLEVPPYGTRRLNATIPLARLQVSDHGFWLGVTTMAIPSSRSSVQYDKADVAEVFKSLGLSTRGVGIATTDGRTHYFWAWRVSRVLDAFAIAGYAVGEPRRPKLWRLLADQTPWPWRRTAGSSAVSVQAAGPSLGPPSTRLSHVADWRSHSRLCVVVDWLVGAAGLVLTGASSADSVVSWPRNTVLVYPATLERLAGALLLPSWMWLLVSCWLLAGFVARKRSRANTSPWPDPKRLRQSLKPTIRWVAVSGLLVLAIVVIGFAFGAAKGSLRVLPDGAHQVSTLGLNSAS